MDHGTWKKHSNPNVETAWHSAITTQNATFIFGGGYLNRKINEYLSNDSTKWLIRKTVIPEGLEDGCAIAVKSGKEILLIGGYGTEKRILNFDVESQIFQVLPFYLNVGRDVISFQTKKTRIWPFV